MSGVGITHHAVEVHYRCDGCDAVFRRTYEFGRQEGGTIYSRWGYYSRQKGEVRSTDKEKWYRRIEKVCDGMWLDYGLADRNCEHWAVEFYDKVLRGGHVWGGCGHQWEICGCLQGSPSIAIAVLLVWIQILKLCNTGHRGFKRCSLIKRLQEVGSTVLVGLHWDSVSRASISQILHSELAPPLGSLL